MSAELAARRLPGVPASAAVARAFVRELLTVAGCPDTDGPELCVSEMVANSVKHSRSAAPGGVIIVRAEVLPGAARIEVHDAGPLPGTVLAGVPAARMSPASESGRGLWIVAQIADRFEIAPGEAWCQFFWSCAPAEVSPLATTPAAGLRPDSYLMEEIR